MAITSANHPIHVVITSTTVAFHLPHNQHTSMAITSATNFGITSGNKIMATTLAINQLTIKLCLKIFIRHTNTNTPRGLFAKNNIFFHT